MITHIANNDNLNNQLQSQKLSSSFENTIGKVPDSRPILSILPVHRSPLHIDKTWNNSVEQKQKENQTSNLNFANDTKSFKNVKLSTENLESITNININEKDRVTATTRNEDITSNYVNFTSGFTRRDRTFRESKTWIKNLFHEIDTDHEIDTELRITPTSTFGSERLLDSNNFFNKNDSYNYNLDIDRDTQSKRKNSNSEGVSQEKSTVMKNNTDMFENINLDVERDYRKENESEIRSDNNIEKPYSIRIYNDSILQLKDDNHHIPPYMHLINEPLIIDITKLINPNVIEINTRASPFFDVDIADDIMDLLNIMEHDVNDAETAVDNEKMHWRISSWIKRQWSKLNSNIFHDQNLN